MKASNSRTKNELIAEVERLRQRVAELESNSGAGADESHLNSLFRAVPTGIGIVINRVFTEVNQLFCQMLGYSRAELIGQSARMIYPNDEEFEFVGREKYRQIKETGVGTVETRCQRKDGAVIDVLLSSAPLDLSDLSRGVVFTALDITERKHVEEQIIRERQQLLSIFNSIDQMIYIADPQTYQILYVNQLLADAFPRNVVGRICYQEFQGRDTPCEFCTNAIILQQKPQPYYWEFHNPVLGKDFAIVDRIIEWSDGRDVRFELAVDITEKNRATRALEESEKKFKNIVEALPLGMHMYKLDGQNRLIFYGANPAADRILGIDHSVFIGKTIEEAFPPLQQTEVPQRYRTAAQDGIPWKTEQIDYDDQRIRGAFEVYAFQTSPGHMAAAFLDVTDRKRSEELLKRMHFAIEHASDAIFWIAPDGRLLYANQAACLSLGYCGAEFEQRHIYDIDALMSKSTWPEHWRKLQTQGALLSESRFKTKSGLIFPVEISQNCYRFGDREYLFASVRDISERKEAEIALRDSEYRFKDIFQTVGNGIAYATRHGNVIEVNDAMVRITGVPREELIGRNIIHLSRKLLSAREVIKILPLLTKAIDGHSIAPLRLEYRDKVLEISARYSTLSQRLIGTVSDITDRLHLEERTRQNEERLRLALEAANEGLWDWNLPSGKAYFSPRYYQMIGYAPDEFEANYENWRKRVHPDDIESAEATIRQALQNKQDTFTIEFRIQTKSGDWRWILGHGQVVEYAADGAPLRLIGTHTDISDRKAAEQQIREYSENLEQLVQARTRELQEKNERLQESRAQLSELLEEMSRARVNLESTNQKLQKEIANRLIKEHKIRHYSTQLENANKELESFSYSVSHDLRAPLRHVCGFADLLQEHLQTVLDDDARHYLNVIMSATNRMGQLIDDLLRFSRTGRAVLRKRKTNLNTIIAKAIEELVAETEGRQISWRIAKLPPVAVDPQMLQLVFQNLIANALKFTRPRPEAVIEIGFEPAHKDQLTIFVRDNGVGFNGQYAEKLFGVFQRLHRQEEFEGTGIGLANVRRIINRHGGRTWATGETDHGATFYFSLPVKTRKGS